jgi:hypothetical protein
VPSEVILEVLEVLKPPKISLKQKNAPPPPQRPTARDDVAPYSDAHPREGVFQRVSPLIPTYDFWNFACLLAELFLSLETPSDSRARFGKAPSAPLGSRLYLQTTIAKLDTMWLIITITAHVRTSTRSTCALHQDCDLNFTHTCIFSRKANRAISARSGSLAPCGGRADVPPTDPGTKSEAVREDNPKSCNKEGEAVILEDLTSSRSGS